jgi:hypothetical protein
VGHLSPILLLPAGATQAHSTLLQREEVKVATSKVYLQLAQVADLVEAQPLQLLRERLLEGLAIRHQHRHLKVIMAAVLTALLAGAAAAAADQAELAAMAHLPPVEAAALELLIQLLDRR